MTNNNNIKIALIHPSYGRPELAFSIHKEWMQACDNPQVVEYLLGVDDNDPNAESYRALFTKEEPLYGRLEVRIGDSRGVITACNSLATLMSPTVELIIIVADDLAPCPHWDTELSKVIAGVDPFTTIRFIAVSDERFVGEDYQEFIVTRAWYTKFGYLLYPGYEHFGADNDVNMTARSLGAIMVATHIVFPHRHYDVGKAAFDSTYARHRVEGCHERAFAILNARIARNFDL